MTTEFNPGGASSLNDAVKKRYEANSNTNAYTDAEKTKLAGIASGAQVNTVSSVAGKTGAVTLANTDVSGLGSLSTKNQAAVSDISATGTASNTTYLRGDGTWATPAGSGAGDMAAAVYDPTAKAADAFSATIS